MYETAFSAANILALIGWIGLVLLPGRAFVNTIASLIVPMLLAIAYAGLIGAYFAEADGGFSSLAEVKLLFASDGLLLAGWLHYLAFDLFVGAWQARTARAEGIPHLVLVPVLILTFLLGPIGFLIFVIIRQARAPSLVLEA
ncbi:MAG: ABA4-like family protein [Bauldia sp.]